MKKLVLIFLVLFSVESASSQWMYALSKKIAGNTGVSTIDSVRALYYFGITQERLAATSDTICVLQRGSAGGAYDTLLSVYGVNSYTNTLAVPVKVDSTYLFAKTKQGSFMKLFYR